MKLYTFSFFQNLPLAPSHLRGGSFDVGGGRATYFILVLKLTEILFSSRGQTWSPSPRVGAEQDAPGTNILFEPQQQIYPVGGPEKGKLSTCSNKEIFDNLCM